MKNRTLLFFFTDEGCDSAVAVTPVLSRLARKSGVDFESYFCSRPESWQGKVLPASGNNHLESFYYLANFYDTILYCSITSLPAYQFRREVLAFGGEILSCRSESEIVEFYVDIFAHFGKPLPSSVTVIPNRPKNKDLPWYAPFCYPELLYSDTLGINESSFTISNMKLTIAGIKDVQYLYCTPEGQNFPMVVIDQVNENDTYGSVTDRIAQRHIGSAQGIGFANADCVCRWLAHYCRENIITLYQDYNWEQFLPTVAKYAQITGNNTITGNQVVYQASTGLVKGNDSVITEFAKYNLVHNLVGLGPRLGFTLQTKFPLEPDWLKSASTPWDSEYSDSYLLEKLEKRAVPVCFLLYAADLGHLPVLNRFLDMMALDGMRAGIAFPSTWYSYHPELLEQLYIPLEMGGVYPNLEPLLSSIGVAVASEAEGFISPEFLTTLLRKAQSDIAAHLGKHMIPRGYYPFQDSNPYYHSGTGKPQYEAISQLGFEYYITYKDGGQRGRIQYENNGMTVLTQQISQWFPGAGHPLKVLKKWERQCAKRRKKWEKDKQTDAVDWVLLSFDTPFFALAPNYLGEIEMEWMRCGWAKYAGIHYIYEAMQYVRRTGGSDGNLFLVKPHELFRFARLARDRGLIPGPKIVI